MYIVTEISVINIVDTNKYNLCQARMLVPCAVLDKSYIFYLGLLEGTVFI